MKKFKEYLALLLACTMTVCACPVYGASRGLLPETPVPEDTFVYEETEDFVPGEVIVCVAGGAETLAEDMAAAESTDALLLGASGTDVAAAKEAVSLYTCSLTAKEAAIEAAAAGEMTAEEAAETLLGASGEAEKPSEILLLHTEEGKEQEAVDFLCTLPHVEFAEPNYLYVFTDYTGTDPAFRGEGSRFVTSPSAWEQQWAYNGTGDYGMGEAGIPIWKDERVNAPVNPETEEYDEDQIVVALMDTGVDYNNPEIRPVLWNCPEDMQETLGCGEFGFDAVAANGGPGDPTDPIDDIVGHGTHCAGIIGASWKDGGIYGIANNVKIMAVRIGREDIKGSDALTGFNFVKKTVENGVNVAAINNSWGGSYSGHAIERAVLELGKLGTLTLFAAGNDGSDNDVRNDTTCTFTSDPYVVVVDSHNEAGELSAFSNYGLKTTHISAPGESILSAAAVVRASIDPKDPENYEPCLDDTTKESYFAPMDHVTIASTGEKEARENAFCFRGEKLATASTASLDVLDDPAENVHLKTESTLTEDGIPCADLIVDLSEADLSGEDGLFFGFRLTKAGWDTGMAPDFDELTLSITAEYPDGTQKKMFDKMYNIAYGKPFAVSAPAVTDADHYRIRVLLKRFDAQTENFVPVDPGFAAFDDFLFTGKCSAYVSMSGTSMACPAVTGEAAVLAAKFARMPSGTRAKELQARIIGSAVPFANEEDKDKNRTGGYANLVKAMEEDYDPVIQSASFDSETGLLTLDGYFFPDAEKAAGEDWYVMLDNTKITDVTWSEDGKTAVFAMGAADQGAREYTIRMRAERSEKSGRSFLWIDTGALADGFMPRLDISGTDAEMYEGTFFGMVPLNGKLYLLSELDIADPKESGSTVWGRDMGKTGAWKRVNDVPVNRYTLGNADMSVEKCSTVMAYQGMIVFALDCLEPVTETCVTYIVTVDPETGKVTTIPAARENYPAEAMYLGVVSLGEKLAYIRTWEDAGSEVVSEISLFAVTENGTLSRKATHVESDKAIFADAIYQEDGTFLAGGISEEGEAVQQGLFRFTVTEEICSCELVTEKQYHMTDDVKDPDSQEASYLTTPLKNALISTGIRDNIGSDTYIFAELSAEGTVTPDPLCVDTAKLQNFAAAAADGKYYVLAQTRNGSEEGRCILCCQDLAELGLATIKNPGDTKKPVPPGPTPTPGPVYGGGGGTVTTNGLAYSKFWVQQNGIWKVVDKNGQIVKNAWLCDDAITANGNNVWYLLKADGTMASDGLLMDATGNCYSLEQEHKGYFGSLRYKDGYYNVGGKQVYLTFCRDHNGAFGAVLNPDGLAALKAAYGVAAYANGNESIRYTSKF